MPAIPLTADGELVRMGVFACCTASLCKPGCDQDLGVFVAVLGFCVTVPGIRAARSHPIIKSAQVVIKP